MKLPNADPRLLPADLPHRSHDGGLFEAALIGPSLPLVVGLAADPEGGTDRRLAVAITLAFYFDDDFGDTFWPKVFFTSTW